MRAVAGPRGIWAYFDRQAALDARSLAVGRVGVAGLLLYDLASRARDLQAHYTDLGVAPRAAFALPDWSFVWSLHTLRGGVGFEAGLFVLAAVAGATLLLGAFTRWATLASLVLALSLQGRNPFLHDGQDDLLRVVLFWGLFLPLGRRWSVDAWWVGRAKRGGAGAARASVRTPQRRPPPSRMARDESGDATAGPEGGTGAGATRALGPSDRLRSLWRETQARPEDRVSGLLALGLTGQLALMYLSSVVGKLQCAWWLEGVGVLRALQLGRYETFAGQWLTGFPGPLRVLNYAVLAVELALPCLLWIPWQRDRLRALAFGMGVGLHLGFAMFLRLSIFPALAIATWLLLAPSQVWAAARLGSEAPAIGPPDWSAGRRAAWLTLPLFALAALYVANTHISTLLLPAWMRRTVETIGLQQYWVVFAPQQPRASTDGWFVGPGVLTNGEPLDVFADRPRVDWERPALISDTFRDTRWRHFYANLIVEWARGSRQQRSLLAVRDATIDWLCRDHAARHPNGPKLFKVSLYFVEHPTDQPGALPRRRLIGQGPCLD